MKIVFLKLSRSLMKIVFLKINRIREAGSGIKKTKREIYSQNYENNYDLTLTLRTFTFTLITAQNLTRRIKIILEIRMAKHDVSS